MIKQINRKFFTRLFLTLIILINNSFAEEKILEKTLITINQFVSHIALDAANEGFRNALSARQILPSKAHIIFSNAQGSISNSAQISKHHASLKPQFMIAIATPAAQTNLKAMKENTIAGFVAVTDPKAANLTDHSTNVIGVSDEPPINELIKFVKEIFPKLKKIGIIYNSGEINSVKMTLNLEKIAAEESIEIMKVAILNSNDIKMAMQKIIGSGECNIIYLPQDNSIVSALNSIVSISKSARIPLIANDPMLVKQGVLLAYGSNYFKSGEQLGHMVADMIENKKINPLIQASNIKELRINQEVVKELGIIIPENIKSRESK